MMNTEMTNSLMKNDNWWESEWYRKDREIANDYISKYRFPTGKWICYFDENNELIYQYVENNE